MRTRSIATMAITLLLVVALPLAAAAGDKRQGPMRLLDGSFDVVAGSSVRVNATNGRAQINVKTSGLEGGNAYTIWAFTFSVPGACTHGVAAVNSACGSGDDADPNTGFAVQQVAGHIIGGNGKANFGGSIPVANAAGAEYHIVVADHGPKDPQQLPEQIKSPSPDTVQIGFILP